MATSSANVGQFLSFNNKNTEALKMIRSNRAGAKLLLYVDFVQTLPPPQKTKKCDHIHLVNFLRRHRM